MIAHDRYLAILTQSDTAVRNAAEAAFSKLLDKIRAGAKPRAALDAVLKEFNADAMAGFREALNTILESSLGPKQIAAYPAGRVQLSAALYANAQAVSATVWRIIEDHMKGPRSARELAKALSEGYAFKEDELKVIAGLPKYLKDEFNRALAAKLKTPALRAAYLEAIRQAEAGKGMDALARVLKVAFYERNRYYANRIARTELHRNYTDRLARELMAEKQIEYVQIRLSSQHPKPDICDRHAKLDAWGLGPGVYPKADAPKPPFHPHCYCLVAAWIDLFPKKPPRFNPDAKRALLASLPPNEARQVAGSADKLARVLKDGDTLEDLYNAGKDPLYRWKRMGDVVNNPLVKATRLSSNTIHFTLTENEKLTIPARLRPVSAAFNFPDEPEYEPIRRALAAIDAAHDDGDLPPLPIDLARDLMPGDDGEYWSDGDHALKIRVSARSKGKEFALACEVGHFLDHQALVPGQAFASLDPKGPLSGVLRRVRASKAVQDIQQYVADPDAYLYLDDPAEWWSRAYAQWVAFRSGLATMKKQADHVIENEVGYWEWSDFEPIAEAIDELFRQKGWL